MSEDGAEVAIQVKELSHIQESVENDAVLEKFRAGDLLVHVIEPPGIERGETGIGLDFSTWGNKLALMESEEGMPNTSSTLIMEGTPIDLYTRPMGFLFDANKVHVENVAARDSGSGHNPTDFQTLADLKDYYKSKPSSQDMNEVVITTRKDAIVGLVVRKGIRASSTLAGLEAVRGFLRTKDCNLPVYEYDEKGGSMDKYQDPNRDDLLKGLSPTVRAIYEKAV